MSLLLQQDRVLEAQEVLDLLKLQELEDYQLDVRGTSETRQGLDFWQQEQEILDLYKQYLQVGSDISFAVFMSGAEITTRVEQLKRNARGQNLNPEQLEKLQDNLQRAGNAALLYPLILDDRLELLLVTSSGVVHKTVPVGRVELNEAITNFRSDVTDRTSNPIPNAQQLYQWIIQPLADDLEQSEADIILYAADGALRYIPLAALYDGKQWLTQRYVINHITAASLTSFSQPNATILNILAGAFSEKGLSVDLGDSQQWFAGLPYAQQEVHHLVEAVPNTTALFSGDFNRMAIEPQANNYNIVHLATHAEFRSGHPSDSFILLGDGDRISLLDLNQWKLPNVDLVVLSACETAVSSDSLGNGEEVLGFGYQMQQTGARAAIASLWQVSDGGTQILMDAFYRALQNGHTKAEALRLAQVALITGDLSVVGATRGDGTIAAVSTRTGLPAAVSDRLNHPYYWAPFILIGNGL